MRSLQRPPKDRPSHQRQSLADSALSVEQLSRDLSDGSRFRGRASEPLGLRARLELRGIRSTINLPQEGSVSLEARCKLGTLRHGFLTNLEHALEERFGFTVLSLLFVHPGQLAERARQTRVIRTEHALPYSQRSLEQWLGLGRLLLGPVQCGQMTEGDRDFQLVRPPDLLLRRQCFFQELLGFAIVAASAVERAEVAQTRGHIGMVRPQCSLTNQERSLQEALGLRRLA